MNSLGLTIPNVHTQIDENANLQGERAQSIEKNLTLMLDDLDFMGNAMHLLTNSYYKAK